MWRVEITETEETVKPSWVRRSLSAIAPCTRILTVSVAAAAILTACGSDSGSSDAQPSASATAAPSASVSTQPQAGEEPGEEPTPIADAGGACQLLSHEMITENLGVELDAAASSARDEVETCVVQVRGHRYPDLTLSLAPTQADAEIFTDVVAPDEGDGVDELGAAAYSVIREPAEDSGPILEVGWLGTGDRIVMLRYTFEPGVGDARAGAMLEGLINLARQVEANR